jgi:CRP/FNR family transcriptional regulator, cyclic AMP receptor protein
MMTKFSVFENEVHIQEFNSGAIIFQEGTPGQIMYAVLEGEVELQLKGVTVNQVGQHEIFGEMALVDGSKRSATAQACTDCKLAVIDKERFEYLV